MTTKEKMIRAEADIISRCGSISGETFVSLRSRRECSSLRQNKTDLLAKNLREYHAASSPETEKVEAKPSRRYFNKSFHHYRFIVAMMGGTSVGIMLFLRLNITIAVLRMVNQTHLYLEEHPNRTVEDFLEEGYSLGGEFNWNNEIVAIILSWYMFSYTLPQTVMAKLSSMLGCRTAVPLSLTVCALSTIVTPWFAYFGWEYVVGCRLINGLGASAVLPLLLSLIEKWMRYDEITLGLSLSQLLNASLIAVTPLVSGYLTEMHWSYAFYLPGLVTIAFCVLWLIMISDDPGTNWLVSEKELSLIYESDNAVDDGSPTAKKEDKKAPGKDCTDQQEESYIPDSWVQILKVPSFYAYIALWICNCSSTTGFIFVLPTYMRQFLKISVAENGFYCFIIQLGCILAVVWPHHLLKQCQRMGMSQTRSYKISYAVCCCIPAFTWIYVGFYHNTQLVMFFLNRAVQPGNDVIVTGCLMSNYAKAGLSGLAFAMINTVGNLSVVGVSTFYGWLLDYSGASNEGWCYIFSSLGGSQIVMFLIFAIFISSGPIRFKNKAKSIEDQPATEHMEESQKRRTTTDSNISDIDNLAKLKRLAEVRQSKN